MQTLTDIVAAVVVHSSAAAFSHFGVTLEAHQLERPAPVERTIARTAGPRRVVNVSSKAKVAPPPTRVVDCPDTAGGITKA